MSTPADDLMAAVLAAPTDPLPRLVLADFLDDTGSPGAAAWATYIRHRTAAAAEPNPIKRELMRDEAAEAAGHITATLTLDAPAFLTAVGGFLDLLPGERFTLRLDGLTPRRVLPESDHCRTHRGLPLIAGTGQTVVGLIDTATPADRGHWLQEFGGIVFVRILTAELEPTLQRMYAPRALALVMPQQSATPLPTTLDEQLSAATAEMMQAFVEELVRQARERKASAIDVTAYTDHFWVRRTENGRSVRWHKLSPAVGRELVRAARLLPTRRLNVRVRPHVTSAGDGVHLLLLNPPAAGGVRLP